MSKGDIDGVSLGGELEEGHGRGDVGGSERGDVGDFAVDDGGGTEVVRGGERSLRSRKDVLGESQSVFSSPLAEVLG